MQSIKANLQELSALLLTQVPPDQAPIVAWPMICGSAVAAKTSAQQFGNETLTIRVPDPKWKSELEGFVPQYLSAFNKVLPNQVKQLRFVEASSTEKSKP